MKDEGQFRFTNGAVIDTDLEFDRINSVINHEFIHSQLYSMTTYGQMVLMLDKNSIFHNKSKEFLEVLFRYMNRMHERVAVNVEIMLECVENGFEAYKDAIEKLKCRNRTYYNYFRKLCCINGKIDSKDSAKILSNILFGIARIALNVDPKQIPLNEISDAKSLEIYFNNPDNSSIISPNKRFDILVNVFFRDNPNNSDIESVIKGSIGFEQMEDYNIIHKLAFENIKNVLSDSPIADRLIERIRTVGERKFYYEEGGEYLAVKPEKINVNKKLLVEILLSKEELVELLNKQKYKELFIQHSLGGFEDIYIVTVYGKKDGRNIIYVLCLINEDDFYNIISNISYNFVFYKTKLIQNEGKSIRKMVKKLPIYIFEDTPILNTIPFIKDFFVAGKFGFIENDNHYIFVVSKKNFILFVDIVKKAKNILIKELCANERLRYVERADEICNVNEVIRLNRTCNEYTMEEFDTVKYK